MDSLREYFLPQLPYPAKTLEAIEAIVAKINVNPQLPRDPNNPDQPTKTFLSMYSIYLGSMELVVSKVLAEQTYFLDFPLANSLKE